MRPGRHFESDITQIIKFLQSCVMGYCMKFGVAIQNQTRIWVRKQKKNPI